jgi:hypothetical protein
MRSSRRQSARKLTLTETMGISSRRSSAVCGMRTTTYFGITCQQSRVTTQRRNLIDELHKYFEFAVNVWLDFAPGDYKTKFPRDCSFPVTIPFTYIGELPAQLKGVPQLLIEIVAFNLPNGDEEAAAQK